MEIKAVVGYRGFYTEYRISKENKDIYLATLKRFDGNDNPPPSSFIITRSVGHWIGSIDDEALINRIGEIIDIHIDSGIFF